MTFQSAVELGVYKEFLSDRAAARICMSASETLTNSAVHDSFPSEIMAFLLIVCKLTS